MKIKQEYLKLLKKYNIKYFIKKENRYICMQELFFQITDKFYDISNDDRNILIKECPFKRIFNENRKNEGNL